jgi:AAA15 family ATPase/GTPase
MILSFRVKNFRSFAEDAVLSMRPVKAYKEYQENIFRNDNVEVLKIAGVYGANASGKSNLVNAIRTMRKILLGSLRRSSVDAIEAEPFELDVDKRTSPTEFNMEMLIDNHVYRYGFSVTKQEVVSEWLFRSLGRQRSVERVMFIRDANTLLESNKQSLPELKTLDMKTLLPNSLLLPRLDQLNNIVAKKVMRWFYDLRVLSGSYSSNYGDYSATHFDDDTFRDKMMRILRFADSSIENVSVKKQEMEVGDLPFRIRMAIPRNAKNVSVQSQTVLVSRRDSNGEHIAFDLEEKESEGTQKMFEMSGPLTDILNTGNILVIDEMEAKLHPILTRKLVGLFRSAEWNPKNAQLLFVTHDATLLRYAGLRRDQIWFCEKNRACESELYCLAEVKSDEKARQEDNLEKKYLEGRFGAVPRFADGLRRSEMERTHESETIEEN